jgi:hypothetical protein
MREIKLQDLKSKTPAELVSTSAAAAASPACCWPARWRGCRGAAVHLVERNSPTTSTPELMRGQPSSSSNRTSFPNREDIHTDGWHGQTLSL